MGFNGSRILITGGAGFIGANLAIELISRGAAVTLVDSMIPEYGGNLFNIEAVRSEVTLNISDVRDEYSMKYLIQGQDYLFNLAGQTSHLDSMQNPYPDLEINARAQLSILESCRKYNPDIKIVFASTRQLYGAPQYLPVDEKHPVHPVDVNGINKMAGEWYHLVYNNVYGIRTVVLRLTNTYGPRMRVRDARQTFLGIWVRRIVEGQPFQIFGDGAQLRDYNYVDDLVEAMLMCAVSQKADGQIYNLGALPPVSLKETADILVRAAGVGHYETVPFPPERKAIDIGDYYADYSKIENELGWRPRVALEEGLKRTVEYYRQYGNHYWETP
ncbi:MAG TPA: GDP-mannose 4,6-dehydratase [Deltaproteobacteria bacterium]|nr:GDP-mannose 4,6-dehydratase [Deltaproteobacteria bacterium]HQB38721.1 GDP-mannose 4,6-dehydratase [Deltaproteobacteria bacterium]